MKPRPVSRRAKPAYPTRREFLAAAAAAAAAAGMPGCDGDASASALVAPIFAYGDGRGSTGCMVVAPPVFLSEEEALQVIREELAKVGITLGEGVPLREVTVEHEDPESRFTLGSNNWLGNAPEIISREADLSAVDHQKRVGVEFVTSRDCDRFRGSGWCSVSSYRTRELAESVADALREQAKRDLRIGVFYDPLESWSFDDIKNVQPTDEESESTRSPWERAEEDARKKSRAKLRQQERDFVKWLETNR